MCGIAGIVARRPVNHRAVQVMIDRMAHRGPDGEGIWASADDTVVLGHRRLAIIDPTPAGAQPMVNPSDDSVLTFNGEIYNYLELAARLKSEGREFRSSCDTEVLMAAYEVWGEQCLAEFNGMFSFALYDARRRRLFCARDRFGEKPFLYVETEDFFAFASEYKALLALAELTPEVDNRRLLTFLRSPRQGIDDERETVFGGIKQLLPGESLSFDLETFTARTDTYWKCEEKDAYHGLSEPDAVQRFKELLIDSVNIRMRSDVPVGSCLSGGLDSSAIVCLNRRHLGPDKPYHVFTGRFPGSAADEWSFASEVIEATDVESHVTEPAAERFLEELPDFIWHNELPVGSASQYAQWCVFRLAREHGVTVLLDGQGADELLAGYEQYFVPYLRARRARGEDDPGEEAAIRKRYPLALLSRRQSWLSGLPASLRYGLAHAFKRGSDFAFGLDLGNAVALGHEEDKTPKSGARALNAALHEDTFEAHLPTLLRYGDRNSMAHSREVRLPFCDHRIAELALSLPPAYLMGGAETKHLLRGAMQGVLPETVRTRWNKQGFLPPQESWLSDTLLSWARETIESGSFAGRGFWHVPWWRRVIERMIRGEAHLAWVLWKPVICEAWFQGFVDRIEAAPKVSVWAPADAAG